LFGEWRDLSLTPLTLATPGARTVPGVAACAEAMNDTDTARRKRILFRAHHRGTREADLLLGGFADKYLAGMTDDEMDQFEAVLELPEPDLMAWYVGRAAPPPDLLGPVLKSILDFKIYE